MAEARVRIQLSLLAQFLDFPEGTEVTAIYPTTDPEVMEMRVSHPSLPQVKEGEGVPLINPTYSRCYFSKFIEWGTQ